MATNPVTDGVATGRTVFDFVLDVYDRVLRGLCLWGVSKHEEGRPDRELRDKLGEWVDEAQDSRGRWQQPVLNKADFERHLETLKLEDDGRRPLGECTSSFNWAKLLYALYIRPKQGREKGIITWRKIPEDEADPANISLVIHSSALWHVINLYQINTGLPSIGAESFRFEFGKLEVMDGRSHLYSFESLGNVNPQAIPQFFPYRLRDITGPREGHLIPGRRLAIDSYLGALKHGNSNDTLDLNDTAISVAQRVKVLLEAMDLMNERDWSKPYLITQSWIDLATRINRRATTDGGKNKSLQRHIVEFIAKDDSVVNSLKKPLRDEDTWKFLLETYVKALFMFDDEETSDKYEFIWNLKMQQSSAQIPKKFTTIVNNQLLRALEALPETIEGKAWLRTATESLPAETLLRVLNTPHRILNQPVIILHHIPDEWDFLGRIID